MKCGDWCITSRTRKPHLYLHGSSIAVCGRGYAPPGEPRIRLSDDVDDKCPDCARFASRLVKYADGVVIDGTATS
jgi:hypothetical protein